MKSGFAYTIGRRHAAEQDPDLRICQDYADSYSDENVTIIAVADGKSGKNSPQAAVTAARANVDAVIAFFRDPATWRIAEKNDFKETALRMLNKALEAAADGAFRFEALRATISAVAVRANGEFLAISIGDGTVAALDREMHPTILLPPYREGARGNRTVYTNDLNGSKAHMSVWGGTLPQSNFIAFTAFTDGADSLTRRKEESTNVLRMAAACTLFGSGNAYISEAIGEIADTYTKDDVALAILTVESDETYATAKNILLEAKAAKDAAAAAEETAAPADPPAPPMPEEIPPMPEEDVDRETQDETVPQEESEPQEIPDDESPAEENAAEDTADAETETEESAPEEETSDIDDELPDPTPAELVILRAVFAHPRTADELTAEGFVRKGHIIEATLPLIRAGRIRYEDGKFAGNE